MAQRVFPVCAQQQWVKDWNAPSCMCCGTSFGTFTRRHHCRACGKCVCDGCSSSRMPLANGQRDRVCNLCLSGPVAPPQAPAGQPPAMAGYGAPQAPMFPPEVEAAVRRFQMENEINPIFIPSLMRLYMYDVVVVADDSGSMASPADPMYPMISRWQELIQSLQLLLRATAAFGKQVDVYFINRGTYRNVQAWEQLAPAFGSPPSGGTNTVRVLDQIWRDRRVGPDLGRPLIVHLFTDGHPTNDSWNEDMQGFERWMRNRPGLSRTYFSILLCTDEEEVCNMYRPLEYRCPGVNGWVGAESGVQGIDVTEDYRGELRDVQALRGPRFRFTMGDYIVKCLVGAIDPAVHSVDMPAGTNIYRRTGGGDGGYNGQSDDGCTVS